MLLEYEMQTINNFECYSLRESFSLSSGIIHKDGLAGFPVNYAKAREFCLKAAQQAAFLRRSNGEVYPNIGVASAENFIGMSHRHGMGVDKVKLKFSFEQDCSSSLKSISS